MGGSDRSLCDCGGREVTRVRVRARVSENESKSESESELVRVSERE